jgi:hypothetical protein
MEDTFRSYAPPQNHICASIGRGFKPGQANPSPAKQIQINCLDFLVLFVRIGTYQWVTANPNKNFSPPLRLVARRARSLSDYGYHVGRIPIFSRA